MYTQCPDCGTAFSVTAEVLKQAAGKVRCGGCGNPFDALEHLSENMPEKRPAHAENTPIPELIPELSDTNASLPKAISAEKSAALLKTLDDLAGSDIRLEDTGVEWRVMEEQDVDTNDAQDENFLQDDGSIDDISSASVDEIRFDDNTPLPDDFESEDELILLSASVSDDVDDDPLPESEQPQDDLTLSEPDEWNDILGEFSESVDKIETAPEVENNVADDEPELEEGQFDMEALLAPQTNASDIDLGGLNELDVSDDLEDREFLERDESELVLDAVESQLDLIDEHEEPAAAEIAVEDELAAPGIAKNETTENQPVEEQYVAPPSEEEQTLNMMIDEELMALAIEDEDGFASTIIVSDDDLAAVRSAQEGDLQRNDAASTLFETIIMEGESVLFDKDKDKLAADKAAAAEVAYINAATDAVNEPQSRRMHYSIVGAAAALTLLLLLQVMHQSREALAKIPIFNDTIGPVYRALGQPLQPDWDITGWRFEASKGSADTEVDDNTDAANEQITIYSRVGNQSEEALPYPLIGISLTDRFEETIGSRMLEPAEYLSNDLDPRELVQPGNTFNAVISIGTPSADTTGFKLDVCYRTSNEQLRCAIDDFK